jgi:short-subunit dehydrogenase
MELQGKAIILTGASSGIGFEVAKLLARERLKLALLARRENILRELADELKNSGSEILPIKCDVSKKAQSKKAYLEVKSHFGQVDIAILNSALSHRTGVEDYDVEVAKEIFEVNVFGILNFIGELLPDFKQRRSGVIVGVSSLSDCRGFPRSGSYNASKAAVTSLLESLRVELKKYNIKVVTVKPGFVQTPMTDGNRYHMPFIMTADKAARIIINGLKKEKRVIQFPLPTAMGSWLLRSMPNFLFEMIAGRIKR